MIEPGFNIGAFGKLPAVGDFVRRRLRGDTITAIDLWLQPWLSEEPLDWNLLDAPACRFAAAPGVFGPTALIGLMTPSHDRVGREFPLIVALEAAPRGCERYELDLDWFDRAEQALPRITRDGRIEALDTHLAELQAAVGAGRRRRRFELPRAASLWWRAEDMDETSTISAQPDSKHLATLISAWRRSPDGEGHTSPLVLDAGLKGPPS